MRQPLSDYRPPSDNFGEVDDAILCGCGHKDYEEETIEVNGKTFCCNCRPTFEDRLNDWLDRFVARIEGLFR